MSPRVRVALAAGLLAGAMTTFAALAPDPAAETIAVRPIVETPRVVEVEMAAPEVTPELIEAAVAAERIRQTQPRTARAQGVRPFVWPSDGGMTGWYGERRGRRAHLGMDIDGSTGDPVWSAGTGRVVHAGGPPAGYSGYGTTVVVDHGDGIETVYAHLSRVAVAAGDHVEAGQLIGAIGTTGNVTGSHLHFEVRLDGHPVNPADWLATRN